MKYFNQIALIDHSSSFHGCHYGLRINEGNFVLKRVLKNYFYRLNPLLIALSFHSLITTDHTRSTLCPSFLIITGTHAFIPFLSLKLHADFSFIFPTSHLKNVIVFKFELTGAELDYKLFVNDYKI